MVKTPKPQVDLSTSCACGAVTVSVRGSIKAMFMCSCLDCQKATGTGHSTVAMVSQAAVVIAGHTQSFSRPSASGATFTRRFCPQCGTPLSGQSSRAPDALLLPVGLFGAEAAWFIPSQLIFASSQHDWDVVADGLPRYIRYRDSGEI